MAEASADNANVNVNMKKGRARRVGRKRRAAGWTLLVLGVVVAGVWTASRWGWWGIYRSTWCLVVGRGTFTVEWGDLDGLNDTSKWWAGGWNSPEVTPAWDLWLEPADDGWTFNTFPAVNVRIASYADYGVLGFWTVELVLWPVPLMLWTTAALLLRSGVLGRRRANSGACVKCGYSLAGLAEGAACPECGRQKQATDRRG